MKTRVTLCIGFFVLLVSWIFFFHYCCHNIGQQQFIPINRFFRGSAYPRKDPQHYNGYNNQILFSSFYTYNNTLKSNFEKQYTIPADEPTLSNTSLKIILMWNAWNLRMADEPLVKAQCPIRNCVFTTDMSLINQSDAIVLHFDTLEDFPLNRQSHQRYVFYHFESPDNTASHIMNDPRFRYGYFNWTMTYRRDSDIFLRDYYGSLVAKTSIDNNTRGARYNYVKHINDKSYVNQIDIKAHVSGTEITIPLDFEKVIRGKTKMITWFVGHCSTPIRREEYVHKLSQYVPIDVYGNCTEKCPSHCDEMLRTQYKFYLAFENSWCPDYVTEKFIRPYLYEAIPIFLGGADYSKYAPPNSYINARDFASPKQLAEYLMLLDKSDSLYASYFSWKKDYYVSVPDMFGWCELCRMIHDSSLPRQVYPDIKKWWMSEAGKCESDSTQYF
ncbi:alpha-(1,3)-fucosyltransferase C-like [Daphnia pulex]|uniref:alpha-(1,3)-fucosyltransferase C-like n=1 Tax=Daphnia pulex TaxID=6669 RepID=UPI001EDFFB03|nr:alpha-(1,3)-fucosyltransferase C-like [Daphnia pulex]